MRTSKILILFFVSLTCSAQSTRWADFEKAWDSYLTSATQANSIKAYNLLPGKVMGGDYPDEQITYRIFSKCWQLDSMIAAGNREALRLGFKLFTIADGAFAGALQIEIGKLIDVNPRLFLQELKNHRQLIVSLDGLVGNYGPDFVDNREMQLEETARRIKSLKLIKDRDLVKTRNECLIELERDK